MAPGDLDWSMLTEDWICFTETFDADAELSELCDDGDSGSGGGGNSLALILGIVGAVVVVGIAVITVVMKRRKSTKPPSESAPPVAAVEHLVPTAPPQPDLAPIKAMALEMMTEETAEFAPEAASLPPGHVSGAEAAAMAEQSVAPEGWTQRNFRAMSASTPRVAYVPTTAEAMAEEPPPPPPEGWGARLAFWRPAGEAAEEPEC